MALLIYGSAPAVQTFIHSPQTIVSTLTLFCDSQQINSATIADRLLRIMTRGRASVATLLMENQGQLSRSITVLSQNNITDPMVVFLILESGDTSVIHLMIHRPERLVEIIMSSVGTPHPIWSTVLASADTKHMQNGSTVELFSNIKVTSLDHPIHHPTHTP